MLAFAFGFASCLVLAVCAPSLFVAMKDKAVALVAKVRNTVGW